MLANLGRSLLNSKILVYNYLKVDYKATTLQNNKIHSWLIKIDGFQPSSIFLIENLFVFINYSGYIGLEFIF